MFAGYGGKWQTKNTAQKCPLLDCSHHILDLIQPAGRSRLCLEFVEKIIQNAYQSLKNWSNKTKESLWKSEKFFLKFRSTGIYLMLRLLHQNKIHILINLLLHISPSKWQTSFVSPKETSQLAAILANHFWLLLTVYWKMTARSPPFSPVPVMVANWKKAIERSKEKYLGLFIPPVQRFKITQWRL